jgi:hypothetical protein
MIPFMAEHSVLQQFSVQAQIQDSHALQDTIFVDVSFKSQMIVVVYSKRVTSIQKMSIIGTLPAKSRLNQVNTTGLVKSEPDLG